ncbi:MAG TPA: transposase [Thermoanaerobaculia bacterium]|nr:transposase [Thermoanaerobaculia bacterium]
MKIRKRVRHPHWDIENGSYFITFNLFDAFPVEEQIRIENERKAHIALIERERGRMTPAEVVALKRVIRSETEKVLDHGAGSCFLRDPRIADVVANAITFFDELRYLLFAWTVMPNHVHMVLKLRERATIDDIMHSIKGYTAQRANALLKREGCFWQADYFDRSIRGRDHMERAIRYVESNPLKAGLTDWGWVRAYWERF